MVENPESGDQRAAPARSRAPVSLMARSSPQLALGSGRPAGQGPPRGGASDAF